MNQDFDIFGRFEKPTVTLCNPDREQLYAIGDIYDTQLSLRYNAMSEFSFKVPAKVDDEDVEYFSLLEYPEPVHLPSPLTHCNSLQRTPPSPHQSLRILSWLRYLHRIFEIYETLSSLYPLHMTFPL